MDIRVSLVLRWNGEMLSATRINYSCIIIIIIIIISAERIYVLFAFIVFMNVFML